MKQAEYSKSTSGEVTTFEVTPAPAPKFGCLLILGGAVALVGLSFMMDPRSGGMGFAMVAMAAFCLWYGWSRDLRPKPHRVRSTFRVAPDWIEAGGRTFRIEDIHRLILRNAITDQELAGVQVYTDNANVAAGMAFRAQSARGANALTLESAGKSTFLAGGMDETTAYGLLQDVSRIVGFNKAA